MLGLILAAHQARELGYKKISLIEFVCWNCDGLIDLENYINDIKIFIDIDFLVYGFDLGDGHPNYVNDPRDRLAIKSFNLNSKKHISPINELENNSHYYALNGYF